MPVFFLYWDDDKEKLHEVQERIKWVEKQVGREVQTAITEMKNQYISMEKQVGYLKPLVKAIYQKPITELGWSQRVVNALTRRFGRYPDFPTLGEVAVLSDEELLMTRNFGPSCLAEVRETLTSLSA